MELKEFKEKRKKLAEDLLELITRFEEETETHVCRLTTIEMFKGTHDAYTMAVDFEVRL